MGLELLYEKKEDSVKILRCFGETDEIWLPDQIEGFPVTELGDYIFSEGFGYDEEVGYQFKTMIDEMLREMGGEEESRIVQIGATICVHTGPYALGVGVMKKYEACAEAGLSEEESLKRYTA